MNDETKEPTVVTDAMVREEATTRLCRQTALCKLSDGELALALMLSLSAQFTELLLAHGDLVDALKKVITRTVKAAPAVEEATLPVTDPDPAA